MRQILGLYLPSDTEGCAEGFIFCSQTAVSPAIMALMGVHPINFAHTHNEKTCSVTICKGYRYEGVRVQAQIRLIGINIYHYISKDDLKYGSKCATL